MLIPVKIHRFIQTLLDFSVGVENECIRSCKMDNCARVSLRGLTSEVGNGFIVVCVHLCSGSGLKVHNWTSGPRIAFIRKSVVLNARTLDFLDFCF